MHENKGLYFIYLLYPGMEANCKMREPIGIARQERVAEIQECDISLSPLRREHPEKVKRSSAVGTLTEEIRREKKSAPAEIYSSARFFVPD